MAKTKEDIIAEFKLKMATLEENEVKEKEALSKIEGMNPDISAFLLSNKEAIKDASNIGKVTRIKDSERQKLAAQLQLCIDAVEDQSKIALVVEGYDILVAGYKLPTMKRMSEEEKAVAFKNTVMSISEDDSELAEWVWTNLEEILTAYKASAKEPPKSGQIALVAHRMTAAASKATENGQTELATAFSKARDLALKAKASESDADIEAAFAAEAEAKALKEKIEAETPAS